MLLIQGLRYVFHKFFSTEMIFGRRDSPAKNDQVMQVRAAGPRVTVIIPTRDRVDLLKNCIQSLQAHTLYENYEILIVNNGSVEPKTIAYLQLVEDAGIYSIDFPGDFNFAAICNFAAERATGQLLCFLNNDAIIIQPEWLDLLVGRALETNVGAVGPVLLEEGDLISDAGIALGLHGVAGPMLRGRRLSDPAVAEILAWDHPVSAISFACAVIGKQKYLDTGGLDEGFAVGLNDVDFGMRSLAQGLTNFVVPSSRVIHKGYGSRRRMSEFRGGFRAVKEVLRFLRKYPGFIFKDELVVKG